MPRESVQLAGLFAVIAHEELAHAEAFRGDAADADQEGAGARASGQSRGLGVEERPLLRRRIGDRSAGERVEKIARQIVQRADIRAAVGAMRCIQRLPFEVPAERGFDFVAGKPAAIRSAARLVCKRNGDRSPRRLARRVRRSSTSCCSRSPIRLFFASLTQAAAAREQACSSGVGIVREQ